MRRLSTASAALLAAALLPGCEAGYSDSHLPSWVSATVRFEDGMTGSALIALGNPRAAPAVRYSAGADFYDGRRLISLTPVPRGGGFDLLVDDALGDSDPVISAGASDAREALASVRAVEGGAIAFSGDEGLRWFDAATGAPVTHGVPERTWHWIGPGNGFSLKQQGGTLWLNLPFRESGLPIFEGVEEILAINWIPLDQTSPEATAAANVLYKSVQAVRARGTSATVDGDLWEWREQRAMAVDSDASVIEGIEGWGGARDGSFGVAARVHDAQLLLAVRIRDDEMRFGEDRIEIEVAGRSWGFPLRDIGAVDGLEDDAVGFYTDAVSFGTGLEVRLPMPDDKPPLTHLPLVVRYVDVDAGEATTVLASAPSMRALALRSWTADPDGSI